MSSRVMELRSTLSAANVTIGHAAVPAKIAPVITAATAGLNFLFIIFFLREWFVCLTLRIIVVDVGG